MLSELYHLYETSNSELTEQKQFELLKILIKRAEISLFWDSNLVNGYTLTMCNKTVYKDNLRDAIIAIICINWDSFDESTHNTIKNILQN